MPLADELEEMLAQLRPLRAALETQPIDANDKRTARELIDDEFYDEDGLPK